tara:strand:- start:888 stop:1799 length:912 start_codon:yes stop_codon:yes gene_type:complete
MYRRLEIEEGPLGSMSLLARAICCQMLKLTNRHNVIEFSGELDHKELAKQLAFRMGGTVSDRRMLPRLVKELMEAGAWRWKGRHLCASKHVATPPKGGRESDASHARVERESRTSGERVVNERRDNPGESKGTTTVTIDNDLDNSLGKNKLSNNLPSNNNNQAHDSEWDKREKPPWLRAAKIIKDLFESETQTAWHSMPKHQTELGPLWRWAEQQARITKSNPEHVMSVVVKSWLADRWVASNGYPLSRLTKEPQSFLLVGKRKPKEKKNDQINALRAEKARLMAARDYDGAQRIADRLSTLR